MAQSETQDPKINEAVKRCIECFSTCVKTISYCLELGGEHAERELITLLEICADICQVSARAMLLGSSVHADVCQACATTCLACANVCDSIPDERMQRCATVCRQCAEACRQMKPKGRVDVSPGAGVLPGQGQDLPPTV